MDVIYVNRDGENAELRYSLRTLKNVNYDQVWVFGGLPSWLDTEQAYHRPRMQKASVYASTRGHIKAACNTAEVSDPFMLWNDDFFAMRRVGDVPVYHRGPLADLMEKLSSVKTPWGKGLVETAAMLAQRGIENPLSFDGHLPLVVYKDEMREALRWAEKARSDAIHTRTLYGNLRFTELDEGVLHEDPKVMRRTDPFPRGAWLSSGDNTFRSTVEPVLRYLFPDPSVYEKG